MEIGDGFARLARRRMGTDLVTRLSSEEEYVVVPITSALFSKAANLYVNRSDKTWGLTDCVSFELMNQVGIQEALTADEHFVQARFKALLLN